jgi:hypothetical protein
MKKFLILISFALVLSLNTYSQLSRGCLSEQRDTTLTQKRHFSKSGGGSGNLPTSYSLEKFAPPVLSQGNLSSCTAWSSAYCGLTIVKRMENGSLSNDAFNPLNLYNRLKAVTSEDPCHAGGCYVSDALNMLEDHGCAKFGDMSNTCGYTSASKYYSDKLYGFEELGVTADNIKTALTKNSPVVFVIQYYNDSWGEEKNHINGVWNGNYGNADGYHAMCIIGYDDNVGGGAFQVQNSWGDDWGQNGHFWIRYKDISHIDQAFMLKADPAKVNESFIANNTNGTNTNNNNTTDNTNNNTNDNTNNINNNTNDNTNNTDNNTNNTLWNGTDEQVFRVYNECSVTAYVAISQYEDGAWINRGWYATQPGRYIDLEIGKRGQDEIYWLAINNANDLVWQDSENGTDMCYDPTDAFTIYDNAKPDCPKYKKFFKETPGFEYEVYTQTLTCPSLDGGRDNSRDRNRDNGDDGDNNNRRRDLNTDNSTNVLDHRHDERDADVANYSWQKGTLLFDLYSKSIIHSTTNRNGDVIYHIYYIDSDNQIREANLTEDRLVSLQAYKFESRENAERWLSSN